MSPAAITHDDDAALNGIIYTLGDSRKIFVNIRLVRHMQLHAIWAKAIRWRIRLYDQQSLTEYLVCFFAAFKRLFVHSEQRRWIDGGSTRRVIWMGESYSARGQGKFDS